MENSQKIEAILLNPGLSSQNKIDQLSNFSDKVVSTITLDEWNLNIVAYACRYLDDIVTIQYLIDRFKNSLDVSLSDYGASILHHAAAKNSYSVFKFLWEKYPQFREIKDYREYTLAHYAYGNEDVAIIKFLYQMQPATFSLSSILDHLPLHIAAQYGSLKTFQALILTNRYITKELDELFGDNHNPLHYAVIFNHVGIVKYLLEIGMSLEKPNENGLCAVHLAAKNGSLDVLKYLWQEKQVNLTKVCNIEDNAQSIHYAVIHGHLSVVEWLSEQGVNINTLLSSGEHLIHLAAYNNHLNIIKWLVQKGVPHDLANSQQKTILHILADNNNKKALYELAEYPFNFLAYDSEGYTPLQNACRNLSWYKSIIRNDDFFIETSQNAFNRIIIARKFKPFFWENEKLIKDIKNIITNKRFADNARKKGRETTESLTQPPDDTELLKFFLAKGSLLEQVTNNDEGNSVVHIAAKYNNLTMLTALAKTNLSLHKPNAKNQYPIELAVYNGCLKTFVYLLEHVSHLLKTQDWHKLLCSAISNVDFDTLNFLVKKNTPYYFTSSAQLHQMNEHGIYPQHALAKSIVKFNQKHSNATIKILKFLIEEHEVDINCKDHQGNTLLNLFSLLNFSTFKDIQSILEYLLSNGSYPYFRDKDNLMPFDILTAKTTYNHQKDSDFKLIYNFMQAYGVRTERLPLFFGKLTTDQYLVARYIKYYPKYYLAELMHSELTPNFLKTAFNQNNFYDIKLLLSFGFAIGYHFTKEELSLLNNNPDLEISFLAIGSKITTSHGIFALTKSHFKTSKTIFSAEDINLLEMTNKTKLNWARIIKAILFNSSAFDLDEPQFQALSNIFFLLIDNLPAMNLKILSLVRTAIDDVLLYQDRSENIRLRHQQLLSRLNQLFISLSFDLTKNFPKLSYLCVNNVLRVDKYVMSYPVNKIFVKNVFEKLACDNDALKRKLWNLYERCSFFSNTNQKLFTAEDLEKDATNQLSLTK